MSEEIPKVLVIGGTELLWQCWQHIFAGKAELICAQSLDKGWEMFMANDFAAIVVEALSGGTIADTEDFVRDIRVGFDGPIVGLSTELTYRTRLQGAGCSHKCGNAAVPDIICMVLGIHR
ncbi:MAG: hypothetical protein NTY81_03700 [Candidatus Staskawiczbacteria bacterium]|nr:hypothetical protein [Candidatus Staskawiczbacteria bacterium]